LKVCESAPSVPQEKLSGVQAAEARGADPVQFELSTVVPSERVQETARVSVPEFAVTTHEPVRVWVKPVPQPVVGAQEE
jgi:hypothetical protein